MLSIMTPLYLLLLPALVYGEMTVYVDLRTDPPLIDVSGYSTVPLHENERPLYKLEDEQLKKSVANYSGAAPTDVFVRNGWGDLYSYGDWKEVTRTIKPTLETKTMTNASTKFSHECHDVLAYLTRNMTVSNVWSNNTIPTLESSDYHFILEFQHLNFTSQWGGQMDQFKTLHFLPINLLMSKCTLNVSLEYEASLFGDIAVNYMNKRNGHHFWAFDVNKVQNKVGLPTTAFHQQNMTVEYYRQLPYISHYSSAVASTSS